MLGYGIRGQPAGLDLAAFNIQRGRDHGMPTYIEMIRFCTEGQIIVNSFSDLVTKRIMTVENAELLNQNYKDVEDVDLWTGILSEIPNDGAVVGPTGTGVIGIQFQNLKNGDRFYFEHGGQAGSFTSRQLIDLKEMSLMKIICLNTGIEELQSNAMKSIDRKYNPPILCNLVKGVNLANWRG